MPRFRSSGACHTTPASVARPPAPAYGRFVADAPEDDLTAPSVRIAATVDRVEVKAEERKDVQVTGSARVRIEGTTTTVDEVGGRIVVRVPVGTHVVLGTTSGRIGLSGPLGEVAITTMSGRVGINGAASVDVRADSATVDVNGVVDRCRIRTQRGRVVVNDCGGPAELATDSGRIDVHSASGSVTAHCVTGRIVVAMDSANDVAAETVNGRIEVSLPPGIRPYNPEVHGLQDNTPEGYDCTVVARSVSGRVTVESR